MATTKRMAKRTVAVLVIVIGIAVVLGGYQRRVASQPVEPRLPAELSMWSLGRVLEDFGATEDQRAQLETLIDKWSPVLTELRTDAERARTSFLEAFAGDQLDVARLHAVVDEQTDTLQSVSHELLKDVIGFYQTLTPEQRERVRQHMERSPTGQRARWGRWWRR